MDSVPLVQGPIGKGQECETYRDPYKAHKHSDDAKTWVKHTGLHNGGMTVLALQVLHSKCRRSRSGMLLRYSPSINRIGSPQIGQSGPGRSAECYRLT